MPKIYTLAKDTEISGSDKLLGTDSTIGANNATKNYVIDDLKTYILSGAGGVADGDKGDITVSSTGNIWTIDDGVVSDSKIASGIDAIKIGGGTVSNTEFGYLDGVTSAIQTQLNARTVSGTAGLIQFSDGSAFASDSNLFWDNTNKRLGVGTNLPSADLDIRSSGTTSATNTIYAENGDNTSFTMRDDGRFFFISRGVFKLNMQYVDTFAAGPWKFLNNAANSNRHIIDGENRRIGVNTITPTANLHVIGSGSTGSTASLLAQNSSGTQLLKVRDDGAIEGASATSSFTQGIGAFYRSGSGSEGLDIGRTSGTTMRLFSGSANLRVFNNAGVSVNTPSLDASAVLQADSITRGFLPPRMTTTDKGLIPVPAAGLQVYDSTLNRMSIHTTIWENIVTEEPNSPNAVANIWVGTQAQYNALIANSSTLYIII